MAKKNGLNKYLLAFEINISRLKTRTESVTTPAFYCGILTTAYVHTSFNDRATKVAVEVLADVTIVAVGVPTDEKV